MSRPERNPKLVYRALDVGGRPLPHDLAAETEVLSACIASTPTLDAIADMLDRREWYGDAHGRIWSALVSLRAAGRPADLVSLCGRLRELDEVQAVGGVEFVSRLASAGFGDPDLEVVQSYVRTIRELAHRRRIVEALQVQLGEAYSGRTGHNDFVEGVESSVFSATRGFETVSEGVDMAQLIAEEEQRIAKIEAGETSSGGVPFGLTTLDAKLGGGAEGEVTIVAGRPSMGKTSLLRDIAVNVASSNHDGIARGVLIFSLEMTKEKFRARMVSALANVNLRKIIAGKLQGVEAERRAAAHDVLRSLPIVIDDTPGLTPTRLRSRVRRAMMRFNTDRQRITIVAIDQLSWMRTERQYGTSTGERARELGDILQSVVEVSKETGVHTLVAAQLNRDVKGRVGKALRPRMTDIAESGQIEMHAHNIIAVHRPEFYEPDKDKLSDEQKRHVECIVLKQRDGARGIVNLEWDAEVARFRSGAL